MKSSSLKLLAAFAFTTIVVQSIGVQSTNAQEKKFGNGRFIKRMFGDLIPQSKPAPRPNLNAKPKPGQQPTLAKRPSQTSQPTLANQKTRARSTDPRSIQPARDVDRRATTNRLPKTPTADRQTAMPTRSTAKATLGFGMMVRVKGEKLIVGQIDPKGNAATAGVRTGDQLVTGGGIDFESVADFNGIAEILQDGDQLEFTVSRGGREKEMLIVYGKAPADQSNEMLEGSFEANNATKSTARQSTMQRPAVNQINTQANSSFMPNGRNVQATSNRSFSNSNQQSTGRSGTSQTIQSQQEEIQRLRNQMEQLKRQGSGISTPTLRVPPSAESVMN